MLKIVSVLAITACLTSQAVLADSNIISIKSKHSVSVTADNLSGLLIKKGMTVFSRIDHAAGAAKVGESIPPTELIVFGNPKIGTKLMQCSPSVAIDLPMKALIWQDSAKQTWIGYNSAQYLASRHDIKGCDPILKKVAKALAGFASKAAS